ncbi:hypothetical protein [Polymorphospora rubra]|uniref:hypothetical protein n=1 Tax=Polymorphospora rubra TaxID=338584 RepID=UPI001BB4572B|nr:hypothetical protein [Polymorphospora rubra]
MRITSQRRSCWSAGGDLVHREAWSAHHRSSRVRRRRAGGDEWRDPHDVAFGELDPVLASELLRDLTEATR